MVIPVTWEYRVPPYTTIQLWKQSQLVGLTIVPPNIAKVHYDSFVDVDTVTVQGSWWHVSLTYNLSTPHSGIITVYIRDRPISIRVDVH